MVIRWDDVDQQDVLGLGVHARDFYLVAGEHPPGGSRGVRQGRGQAGEPQSQSPGERRSANSRGAPGSWGRGPREEPWRHRSLGGPGARPGLPSHGACAGRSVDRGGRPGPLGAPRSFSPPRPRGPREAGQKRRKPRAGCRRGWRRGGSDDSAAGSAGPPGSRRRRRCRCGPQDPRTPHPATAPPSSGAAAEGSPAATTHGPVTSGVARCTSRPALSCARSPPPVGSGTRRGRALTQSAARGPRGSESAPAQWLAAPTHARLHTPAQ